MEWTEAFIIALFGIVLPTADVYSDWAFGLKLLLMTGFIFVHMYFFVIKSQVLPDSIHCTVTEILKGRFGQPLPCQVAQKYS